MRFDAGLNPPIISLYLGNVLRGTGGIILKVYEVQLECVYHTKKFSDHMWHPSHKVVNMFSVFCELIGLVASVVDGDFSRTASRNIWCSLALSVQGLLTYEAVSETWSFSSSNNDLYGIMNGSFAGDVLCFYI